MSGLKERAVWIVRWTIIGLVMLGVLGFALQNADMVKLTIWTWQSGDVPIYLIAYFAFALGILVAAVIAAANQVHQRLLLSRARRDVQRLKDELIRLRRVSLDEALLDDEELGAEPGAAPDPDAR